MHESRKFWNIMFRVQVKKHFSSKYQQSNIQSNLDTVPPRYYDILNTMPHLNVPNKIQYKLDGE